MATWAEPPRRCEAAAEAPNGEVSAAGVEIVLSAAVKHDSAAAKVATIWSASMAKGRRRPVIMLVSCRSAAEIHLVYSSGSIRP